MNKDLPNILSWARIALAPVIVVLYLVPGWGALVACPLFAIAAVTDYIDGRLAREQRLSSRFGVFIDPVADKVLVVMVLLVLVAEPEPVVHRGLLAVVAGAVILRELIQSAVRDWMAQEGKTEQVGVTTLSKTKTVLQLIALGMLIGVKAVAQLNALADVRLLQPDWVAVAGTALLILAAVLGLYTMAGFLRVAAGSGPPGG